MTNQKITLSLKDLHSPEVEDKLRQHAAVESAQASYRETASRPSRLPVPDDERGSFWYNTIINMTVFGLIGGLLAFGMGQVIRLFHHDMRSQAIELVRAREQIGNRFLNGDVTRESVTRNLRILDDDGRDNPYYKIYINNQISQHERDAQIATEIRKDRIRDFFSNVLFYSTCGIMIAIALGMADSIATRNLEGAVMYGSVGAALGLVGGIVVSLFADALYHAMGGGNMSADPNLGRQILARSVSWGVLGMFFSASPGIVMRNYRKLIFGILGGLLGGVLGGALWDPIARATPDNEWISRLVAITAIGVITGLGTGFIENAAKMGWLKVIEGLIAGKQFIVYRNPTFIGSSPQCEIYLFKDNTVLRRHAALHIIAGGYEIEDLGTERTIVNGRPIRRTRLRNGDRVQIGQTCFAFHEKARAAD